MCVNLDDVKLTLENDQGFYRAYLRSGAGAKMGTLERYAKELCGINNMSLSCKQQLRTYFNDRYFDHGIQLSYTEKEDLARYRADQLAVVRAKETTINCSSTSTTSKETTVFFETKHFLKGQDIDQTSKEAIYQAIANKEAEIKKLEAIENKPKSLVREIEEAKAGIKKLVEYLDSKESA